MKSNLILAASVAALPVLAGNQWPQFRGPDGNGHSDARNLPVTWSEKENLKWKTALHDRAWSSPVILDGQIWLTTATEDGRKLYALCVDQATGKIVHDLKLFDVDTPQFAHKFNTYASPSPVLEPGRVYITFGSPGTACLDARTGQVLWQRRDLECNHFRGAGSSPILHGDLLIMNFDGSDHQFVLALDKKTGQTRWRADRSIDFKDLKDGKPGADGDWRKAYSTPHVAVFDGQPVLISIGAKAAYGYNPITGQEYWRLEERTSHSCASRPVVGQGYIFYPTGFSRGQVLAVRPGGRGDITETHVSWRATKGVPQKPSLLLVNDLLFMVSDGGVAGCLEALTGKEIWSERVGGNHSASPVYAEGRIYFCNEEGKTTVIEAGRQFNKLADNKLDEGFMASPAIAGQALYLRTRTHLYRIEKTASE